MYIEAHLSSPCGVDVECCILKAKGAVAVASDIMISQNWDTHFVEERQQYADKSYTR